MSKTGRVVSTATVAAACLISLATAWAAPKDSRKSDVPLDRLPPAVRDAARKAVEGVTLTDATVRRKKSAVSYTLKGSAAGRRYTIRTDDGGRVLGVKADGDGRAGAGKDVRPGAADAAAAAAAASPARLVGTIGHAAVRESSGVVASRRHAGVLWTHNDRGNPAALYAVARDGRLLAEYPVAAAADDWEDVATDDAGNLYVANTGNNKATRDVIEVHRLPEPDPAAARAAAPLRPDRTWRLRFPAAPFDCEALFVHDGHGYVVSKLRTGGPASIYRFPLAAAAAAAGEAVLERVTEIPVRSPVTGADLSRDGRRLAVLSGAGLHVFAVDGDVARAGTAPPDVTPVPPRKLEGVCFAADGILMTAESREVYLVAQ